MQKPDVPLHRRSTRSVIRKTSQPNKPTLDQLLQLKKPQEKFIAACSDNDLFTGNNESQLFNNKKKKKKTSSAMTHFESLFFFSFPQ